MFDAPTNNRLIAGIVLLSALVSSQLSVLTADEPPPARHRPIAGLEPAAVANQLQRYCFECHGGDTQEANIRLDTLDLAIVNPADSTVLQAALKAIDTERMPPEDAQQPAMADRQRLSSWLSERLSEAAMEARRSSTWTRNRRLTVEEYNYTMQSLFAVDAHFVANFPPDPISMEGYQNDSQLLQLSSLQMECYLQSARQAVQRYVSFGPADESPLRYHIELEDLDYTTADRYGTRKRAPQPVSLENFEARRSANRNAAPKYAGPLSPMPPGVFSTEEELRAAIPKLHQQFLAIPHCLATGEMIVRIRAAATADRNGRFPRMRVESGITLGDGDAMDTRRLGEVDVTAPPSEPMVYEFRIRMEDVPTKGTLHDEDVYDRLSVFDMLQLFVSNVSRDDQAIYGLGRGGYPKQAADRVEAPLKQMADAGVNFLYLDCVEIEMLPKAPGGGDYDWSVDRDRAEQGVNQQLEVATELLERFMRRAYRRPIAESEIADKMKLFSTLCESGSSFEESLRDTLTAVLISPAFLFLESRSPSEQHRQLVELPDSHQLASRLSYFLWLQPPDTKLMQLADEGALSKPEVLASEAVRLLDDPRSRRFFDRFCRQWLRLDKHRHVAVNAQSHPTYDEDLGELTIQETLTTFADLFASGGSALELIDADYAFINDRLADHYGLPLVTEGELQRVVLPTGSVRGGLLTQASLLTMNSDGVDSHPIRRGVWLLDRLLHSPPPPPPPDVPQIDDEDPNFRGLSLKEKIQLHRAPGACQSCHRKIDPWGIAFENFDATGRWREAVSSGEQDRQSTGAAIDATVQLPDGQRIRGISELKRYLSQERSEQFTRALVHHMLTYALGRSPDHADGPQIDAIHQRFAASGYRMRELVLGIVGSEAFRL